MAKQKKLSEKTYKVIIDKEINVNGKPRKVNEVFKEEETPELKRLVKHDYLQIVPL